jgi:hypothetical protein
MGEYFNQAHLQWGEYFNQAHLQWGDPIVVDELYGYVLPHASTAFTGHIVSHTLRFKPKASFDKVVVLYCPASKVENVEVDGVRYFPEYYVPMRCIETALERWGLHAAIVGVNAATKPRNLELFKRCLVVVSADFSHGGPLRNAVEAENIAATALMFKNTETRFMDAAVDDPRTFQLLFRLFPNFNLQWVGRTRSPGVSGTGYLSFLLVQHFKPRGGMRGMFVTCYDENMVARECLGNLGEHTQQEENELVDKVLKLGQTASRLTGGKDKGPKVRYATITYLYPSGSNVFLRGWHTVEGNVIFLPKLFLEQTFDNGKWIEESDTSWPVPKVFRMDETVAKLNDKAHFHAPTALQFLTTHCSHFSVK